MHGRWLIVILFPALALGQSSPPSQADHADADATTGVVLPLPPRPNIPPDAPVLTVNGLCEKPAGSGAKEAAPSKPTAPDDPKNPAGDAAAAHTPVADTDCKTVVSQDQFRYIISVLDSDATLKNQRLFAEQLPELMLFAHTASEMGIDKDPHFRAFLNYKYAQALQQLLFAYMQGKMRQMTDAEVEKYYKEHPERFEKFALERILVPRSDMDTVLENFHPGQAPPSTPDPKMQKMAEKIQREAAAGGNSEKLEAKAYKAAHSKQEPPDVNLGDQWTIDNLPPELRNVIPHLQVGQVTQPVSKPVGWQIFKVTGRQTVPLSEAKPFLEALLLKDWREGLTSSIHSEFNEDYFGGSGDAHPKQADETKPKPESSK